MLDRLDERINKIFQAFDDVRKAEITGDQTALSQGLAGGLLESCLLLQDALAEQTLTDIRVEGSSISILRRVQSEGTFDNFLEIERRLLSMTKLQEDAIEELLSAVKVVVRAGSDASLHEWVTALGNLKQAVCREAEQRGSRERRAWLKRAFIGSGGAMMALVNVVGFPGVPIPEAVAKMSIAAGVWCIREAAGEQLKDFFRI